MCRSPAAEKMLLHVGGGKFEARSRGTAAQAYTKMPGPVRDFLTRMAIGDMGHTPTLVKEEDIEWADVVLVMENCHFEDVAERFPQSLRKMHLFLDYCFGEEGMELGDPMGQGEKVFNKILGKIREAIEALVKRG